MITIFSGKGHENEANQFAVELLFPSQHAKSILKRNPLNMNLVKEMAARYGTSLTSTLIRLVKQNDKDCCAGKQRGKQRDGPFASCFFVVHEWNKQGE